MKGHLEATDIHAENGISVLSDNTLVASGNVQVCNGNLQIGNASEAGIVTIAGSLTVDNGDLIVVNGTLNLARGSKVIVDGNVSVGVVGGTTGNIKQTGGITANMDVDGTVTINKGTVSIPGTIINATSVKVEKDGVLTVTVKPDHYDESSKGTLNEGGTGATDEPDVVYDLQLTSLEIKGQPVSLNQSDKTGSVTLTDSQAEADDVPFWAAKYSMDAPEVSFKEGNSDVASNATTAITDGDVFTIRLTKEGARTITYNVKVTVLDPSDDAAISSIVVKGQTAVKDTSVNQGTGDGTPNNAIGYRVDLTYAQANDTTVTQLVATAADKNATVSFLDNGGSSSGITGIGDNHKGKVNDNGVFWLTVTAEDGTTNVSYQVTIKVAAQPAQKADVTLTSLGKPGTELKATGTNAYELLIRGDASNVTSKGWLKSYVKAEGTADDLKTPISDAAPVNGVFTLTFDGVANGDDQEITVTLKSATDEQKVERDLADVQADYANGSKLAVNLTTDLTTTGVEKAVEEKIAGTGDWHSTITADATYVGDEWSGVPSKGSMDTGDVRVVITVKSGDVTKTITTTLSVQGTNANP